jgi:putative endonuclease
LPTGIQPPVIPTKVGIHGSTARAADKSIPASAGMTAVYMIGNGKPFFVYLLASGVRGTLYVGVTSNLLQRVWQHKNKELPGFTARYGVDRLVWYEMHASAEAAITREKQIKEWKRNWKINLIERDNLNWLDLYPALTGS